MLQRVKSHVRTQYPTLWHAVKHEYSRLLDLRNIVQGRQGRPPALIPRGLHDGFTMRGNVPVLYAYKDGSQSAAIAYKTEMIAAALAKIARREVGVYGQVDVWLYEALGKYPIQGLSVAVMGSADQGFGPWYECISLEFGAKPTAIDYNPINFPDDRIKFLNAPIQAPFTSFDAALSISSFEHDGLGRYGDPIDPDGDLKAMRQMKDIIKPGGLLYLTVPIGLDKVIFNIHRIYGRKRLPHLLNGWTVLETIGLEDRLLDRDTGYGWNPMEIVSTPRGLIEQQMHPELPEYAPLWVLRNN